MSKDEISQPRTPKEFIEWFEQKLEITKERREELKKQNILHEGIAKIFYEELFPLYRFLQHKDEEWHDVKIEYISGDQNFDVKVVSNREFIPKYIEITQADMDEDQYLRMRFFLEQGSVSMNGKVTKEGSKRIGLQILVDEEFSEESGSNLKKKKQIEIAIKKKMVVAKRPNSTALLVYFDDYAVFSRDRDREEMSVFLDSAYALCKDKYTNLFVVGASGVFFWEN